MQVVWSMSIVSSNYDSIGVYPELKSLTLFRSDRIYSNVVPIEFWTFYDVICMVYKSKDQENVVDLLIRDL